MSVANYLTPRINTREFLKVKPVARFSRLHIPALFKANMLAIFHNFQFWTTPGLTALIDSIFL